MASLNSSGELAQAFKEMQQPFDLETFGTTTLPDGYFGNYYGNDNSSIKIRSFKANQFIDKTGNAIFANNKYLEIFAINSIFHDKTWTFVVNNSAFMDCTNLSRCSLLEGLPIDYLFNDSFKNCTSITNFNLSSEGSLGIWAGAFEGAKMVLMPGVRSFSIYSSNIWGGAFYNCTIIDSKTGESLEYGILSSFYNGNIRWSAHDANFVYGYGNQVLFNPNTTNWTWAETNQPRPGQADTPFKN